MSHPPTPPASPDALSLGDALPGVLGLVFGMSRAWPELAAPELEAGVPCPTGRLPALRFRPPGAPEVLVAWTGAGVLEESLRAWLDRQAGEDPLELFVVDALAPFPESALRGYVLEDGQRDPIPHRDGRVESMALGVFLRAEAGRVRVLPPGADPVPFPDELAELLSRARAEASRWHQKAERKDQDQTRARAEMERQKMRAEHWKAEARRLKAALGEQSEGEESTAEIVLERG